MKRIVFGMLALAALSGVAVAADMPVKARPAPLPVPVFSWTGCYIGGFVGGAWGDRTVRTRDINGYNGPDTWFYDVDSTVIGGGTLGCNYQVSRFVAGVELEGGYLRARGSALDPLSPFLPLDTRSSTQFGDWYFVAAGRAGLAFDRALFYVKGGAAFIDTRVSVVDNNAAGAGTALINATYSDTRTTWALGGGIEYAFTNNWTLKGEYLYIDTRQTVNTCGISSNAPAGPPFCWTHDIPGLHTAKIGLNYKFDWGAPVVAKY